MLAVNLQFYIAPLREKSDTISNAYLAKLSLHAVALKKRFHASQVHGTNRLVISIAREDVM